jgi:hypothetical protein
MKICELREYYGTWANMTRKLELGSTTYLGWVRKGYIPFATQCVIEKKTNKKFKANEGHCKAE